MANDRDYDREQDFRGEPSREDDRAQRAERGERDIRQSDRGVERSDWSDAVESEEALEPSDERAPDEE
ncbi:MAG TPA: hypothetical protein VJ717_15575 [Gemmatimonadaceae bacterium]|nr:hypothetical protein [Gemmatimonadaceae bacterium]